MCSFNGRTFTHKQSRGFSLLELIVVFSIVGILFALAAERYQSSIRESQHTVINFQANTFMRVIDNVRAISTIQKSSVVDMGNGVKVYLNKAGWPIASNINGHKPVINASQKGCVSLWQGLFREASSKNKPSDKNILGNFEISLIDSYICRYKLTRKQEGSFFFDYDVITGNVVITSHEL